MSAFAPTRASANAADATEAAVSASAGDPAIAAFSIGDGDGEEFDERGHVDHGGRPLEDDLHAEDRSQHAQWCGAVHSAAQWCGAQCCGAQWWCAVVWRERDSL